MVESQVDIVEDPRVEMFDTEHLTAPFESNLRIFLLQFPADHPAHETSPIGLRHGAGVDEVAVAKNGQPVSDLKNLLKAVGDIDNPDTLRLQPAYHLEEILQFLLRQGG